MNALFVRKVLPFRQVEKYSILHLGARPVYLNESGTAIWDLIDGRSTARDIAKILASRNDSPPIAVEKMSSKVESFLEELFLIGLLLKYEDGTFKERPRPTLPVTENSAAAPDSQNAKASQELFRPIQSECVTAQVKKTGTSLSDQFDDLYWEKFYIHKMHLELTYRCNFRCVHCYNPTHGGGSTEMTTGEWERALEQLAGLGCYLLTFTGGEVFVRKDTIQILQAACDKGFTFRLNTNGSLIDEHMLKQLEPMRPFLQSVDISFYGAEAEVHDALAKRTGSFFSTMRAVQLLSEAKMNLVTKFVTMRDNFHGMDLFEDNMRKLGVPHVVNTGSLIPRTNRDMSPLVQLTTDKQYNEMLVTHSDPKGGNDPGSCKPGHVRGAITPDGFVSPCEWLTDFKLGNLRDRSLAEIWYGSEFLSFRKIFEQESECSSCGLQPSCSRCPAHSYLETGSLLQCAPNERHFAELYQNFNAAKA